MTIAATTPPTTMGVTTRTYDPPNLEIDLCPLAISSYDGFDLAGHVEGSEVEDCVVEVSIAGVTRVCRVHGGQWAVHFEAGALSRRASGVAPASVTIRDHQFNTSTADEVVMIEEFVDGFVYVDDIQPAAVAAAMGEGRLAASGELGLGTHLDRRDLAVYLVRDDAADTVVSEGHIERGWDHGEFRARIPIEGVAQGRYRVKAVLTDETDRALTRLALSNPFPLG
jgi:hypothetical protein